MTSLAVSDVYCPKRLKQEHLPQSALYGDGAALGWELSAEPFRLSQARYDEIQRFGSVLWHFVKAVDLLYRESSKGKMPAWIAKVLDQGKPESLVKYGQMNRFKSHLPRVIRPDLLMTEAGWALCEIDSVPGGIGFTSALSQAYRKSCFSVIEAEETMPGLFLKMLRSMVPDQENPVIAIVISEEANDYYQEMLWLTGQIQQQYPDLYLVKPQQIDLVRDQLVFTNDTGVEKKIDLIYRFFELFDLPNIPKMELIQYAVKKGLVQCTPPFKPHTEEKAALAMLHHPVLQSFWSTQLGEADFLWLRQMVPQGWILDPTPLPPQAVIPNLSKSGIPLQSFEALQDMTQKERELIIKPSGFSPFAWGARGVTVGHDVSGAIWNETVQKALEAYPQNPHILQRFEKPVATEIQRIKNLETYETAPLNVRTRFCPYFFIIEDEPVLAGILATSCPADKKVIHGMKDAVLAPCQVVSE